MSQHNDHIRLPAFRNVEKLQKELEVAGVGKLRQWRRDEVEWISSTNFFGFGSHTEVGFRDDLALYLESEKKDYVRCTKLKLNTYRRDGNLPGYAFLADKTPTLFRILNIPLPDGLTEAITSHGNFRLETEDYEIKAWLDPGDKLDSYRLTIVTK